MQATHPPCRRLAATLATAFAVGTASLAAQVDRYELGLRLRAFERELAIVTDAARRAPAFRQLERGVAAFFRLDTTGVAHAVNAARWALRGRNPTATEAFVDRLQLHLDARLVDAAGPAAMTLSAIPAPHGDDDDDDDDNDDVDAGTAPPPTDLRLAIAFDGRSEPTFQGPIAGLPQALALPLGELAAGDHVLHWHVRQGDTELLHREQALAIAADLEPRLQRLAATPAAEPPLPPLEGATLAQLVRTLRGMTKGRAEETLLPGERLLREAEAVAAQSPDARYYQRNRIGQFWLRVPTAAGAVTVRVCVPAAVATAADASVPIVVALHGAGGSENLFCDGYGDGAIVRQCEQRGWLLAAPRTAGMAGVDVPLLVAALAERYPIDRKRVFAVGHSMGAMQLVDGAARDPAAFAAVAALSGGGNVRQSDALPRLPFFVAAGSRDFGRDMCQALTRQLQARGVPVTYREYPDVEHLAVVQIALPDVFAFFDRQLER